MTATLERHSARIGSDIDHIGNMDTPMLREELSRALDLTARHLLYLAAVWAELERRGEDLSALRSGLVVYLPLIAAKTVMPEVVVRFAGNQTLLRAVSMLPPEKQAKIAAGEPVLVVERQGDKFAQRMLPVHTLTWHQAKQVFADRCIRTETEQIAYLNVVAPRDMRTPETLDLESLLSKAKDAVKLVETATEKRAKKRAADELRLVAEKISLLVR